VKYYEKRAVMLDGNQLKNCRVLLKLFYQGIVKNALLQREKGQAFHEFNNFAFF
jgi:hypothetical protein